jgi:hypothetical protein
MRIIRRITSKWATSPGTKTESLHEGGAHINGKMKANARVAYQVTVNESKSARRWAKTHSMAGNIDTHDENNRK